MDNATIEINDLAIGYKIKKGNSVVSSGLTATIRKGELTCVLGPSGAGKTTLLRTLTGMQPALDGDVRVLDTPMKKHKSSELSRTFATVMTTHEDVGSKTVTEVVAMDRRANAGMWGRWSEKDNTVVDQCIGWLGIEHLSERKMSTISDGERQRVMIARAMAKETPIIVLDEPTSMLDYPGKLEMLLLLRRLARAHNKTIIVATHDMEHALQVADTVWLIDQKHGLTVGSPEDLCIDGSVESYFAREGISFDSETHAFTIHHETAREVVVMGNSASVEYRTMCHAMMRQGIKPVADEGEHVSDPVKVRVPGDGTYRMIEAGKETLKVEKIAHLVSVIVPAITRHKIAEIRGEAGMNQYE